MLILREFIYDIVICAIIMEKLSSLWEGGNLIVIKYFFSPIYMLSGKINILLISIESYYFAILSGGSSISIEPPVTDFGTKSV